MSSVPTNRNAGDPPVRRSATALRQRPGLAQVVIDSTTIIYDARAQRSHQLNASAGLVWSMLSEGRSLESIQAELAGRFPADIQDVQSDTESVVGDLMDADLVVTDGELRDGTDLPAGSLLSHESQPHETGSHVSQQHEAGSPASQPHDSGPHKTNSHVREVQRSVADTSREADLAATIEGRSGAVVDDVSRTPCFDALGFTFDVTGPAEVIAQLDTSLRTIESPLPAMHHYTIDDYQPAQGQLDTVGSSDSGEGGTGEGGRDAVADQAEAPPPAEPAAELVQVRLDDLDPMPASRSDVASTVLRHANQRACTDNSVALLMHASAISTPDGVVAFSGSMNAGKSTLVAGLLRRGHTYVTDEAVAIDLDDLSVAAYPKPIGIDTGSYDLFPELAGSANPHSTDRWWVSPLDIGAGAAVTNTSTHPLRAIVFVSFAGDGSDHSEKLDPPDAVLEMTSNLFNLAEHGQAGLDAMARIATTLPVYRLTHTGLDPAIEWIETTFTR